MSGLIYEQESYRIRGACFEVYREMGAGFLEAVYQECMERELRMSSVPFIAHPRIQMNYKGDRLKCEYIPDFVCFQKIIVEIKAVSSIVDEHRAQLHNYLKATRMRLGFLVNFGHHPKVEIERIVR